VAIGCFEGLPTTVIFERLGSEVISMRRASRKERRFPMNPRLKHVPPLTDAEETEIQRQIAEDPDDFEATDEQLAQLRPLAEVLPDLYASIQRARGRPVTGKARQVVSLRLDPEVISKFKATGPGWQARINEILKKAKVG
jgi:uncharacterized protein (DUF4415 family)